jgi:hypothetical protein
MSLPKLLGAGSSVLMTFGVASAFATTGSMVLYELRPAAQHAVAL